MHHVVGGLCGQITSLAGAHASLSDRLAAVESTLAELLARSDPEAAHVLPACHEALAKASSAVSSLIPAPDTPFFMTTPPPLADEHPEPVSEPVCAAPVPCELIASAPECSSVAATPCQKNDEPDGVVTAETLIPETTKLLEEMSNRFASMSRKQAELAQMHLRAARAAARENTPAPEADA